MHLLVATPVHDGRVHLGWVRGVMDSRACFDRWELSIAEGSFLPTNRDKLTKNFLESKATHMLCVDSDIVWSAQDAQDLLDENEDIIAGHYVKRGTDKSAHIRSGRHRGAFLVGAGFLLIKRKVIEHLYDIYPERYETDDGELVAPLWWPQVVDGNSFGVAYSEDYGFCVRHYAAGGSQIAVHTGVRLGHCGQAIYG